MVTGSADAPLMSAEPDPKSVPSGSRMAQLHPLWLLQDPLTSLADPHGLLASTAGRTRSRNAWADPVLGLSGSAPGFSGSHKASADLLQALADLVRPQRIRSIAIRIRED